jgi:hypothetical protein
MSRLTISAVDLSYAKVQNRLAKEYASDILKDIAHLIISENDQGFTSLYFNLPTIFNIPNLGGIDPQIKIYAIVIETLSKHMGFKVEFRKSPNWNNAILFISWESAEKKMQDQHDDDVIKYYTTKFDERDTNNIPLMLSLTDNIIQLKRLSGKKNTLEARNLVYNITQIKHIEDCVVELIQLIKYEILSAHERNQQEIIINLPTIFDIDKMSIAYSQKKIYSLLLQDISLAKGFNILLKLKNVPQLMIYWKGKQTSIDRDKKIINKVLK